MAENFLNRLARNPYAPIDAASVSWIDEMGNGLDDWRNVIAPAPKQPATQSWGDLGYGIATAPMRFGNALMDSVNPYKGNEHPITQPDASSWQVPPLLSESWDAINSFGNAYSNGMSEDDMRRNANIAAGLTMGGGGLAARPMEMLSANASKEASVPALASALDMSPEARLARARDMGFDTDTTWYHGTTGDFDAFDSKMYGSTTGADGAKKAAFFASDPDIASAYVGLAPSRDYTDLVKLQEQAMAKGNSAEFDRIEGILENFQQEGVPTGGSIIPARLPNNMQTFDFYGRPWEDGAMVSAIDNARAAGLPGVVFKNIADHPYDNTRLSSVAAVFDPRNIRSVNAAFDPSKSDSANLLAANADSRASLPALASGVGYDQEKPYLWPWR